MDQPVKRESRPRAWVLQDEESLPLLQPPIPLHPGDSLHGLAVGVRELWQSLGFTGSQMCWPQRGRRVLYSSLLTHTCMACKATQGPKLVTVLTFKGILHHAYHTVSISHFKSRFHSSQCKPATWHLYIYYIYHCWSNGRPCQRNASNGLNDKVIVRLYCIFWSDFIFQSLIQAFCFNFVLWYQSQKYANLDVWQNGKQQFFLKSNKRRKEKWLKTLIVCMSGSHAIEKGEEERRGK